MIKKVEMYSSVCDNCGEVWEHWHHGWTCVPDKEGLEEELNEHSWYTEETGDDENRDLHYCPLCFTIDDNDEMHVKTERTKPPKP